MREALRAAGRDGGREDSRGSDSAAGVRLLFVDDEPGIRKTVSYLLKKEGYQFDVASSGTEARQRLDAAALVSHHLDLAAFQEGVELARRRVAMKVVFVGAGTHG